MGHVDGQHTDEHHEDAGRLRRAWRRGDGSPRMRQVIVAAGIIGVVAAPAGMAATGQSLREGVRNGTATKETEIVSRNGAATGIKGGYATRQSNLSASGGGAIYGCRSGVGSSSSTPPQNPCVRANNLARGLAFEFNATDGNIVGTFTAGSGGDSKKPFTTNATGVATGLNADRVDGQDAAAIAKTAIDAAATDATTRANAAKERWVLIGADGAIVKQSGGFTAVNCYQANANCYISAGDDVTNRAITTEILTTNGANDAGIPGQLSGDTSAAPCGLDLVACAPPGTETNNVFVVTPRNSDGTAVDPDGPDNIAGNGDDQVKNYSFYAKISAATAG